MRSALAAAGCAALAVGCSFDPTVSPMTVSALPDAATTEARGLCDSGASGLVGCFLFDDDDDVIADHSGHANHAQVSAAAYGDGVAGLALASSSALDSYIDDSPSLDTADALTLEAWVQLQADVTSSRQGIFDNNGQYGLFVVAGNRVACSANSVTSLETADGALVAGTWQHVACAYDGAMMRIYVDGAMLAERAAQGAITTDRTDGSAIAQNSPDGDELVGGIDTLRVWDRGLSRGELCVGASLSCDP